MPRSPPSALILVVRRELRRGPCGAVARMLYWLGDGSHHRLGSRSYRGGSRRRDSRRGLPTLVIGRGTIIEALLEFLLGGAQRPGQLGDLGAPIENDHDDNQDDDAVNTKDFCGWSEMHGYASYVGLYRGYTRLRTTCTSAPTTRPDDC